MKRNSVKSCVSIFFIKLPDQKRNSRPWRLQLHHDELITLNYNGKHDLKHGLAPTQTWYLWVQVDESRIVPIDHIMLGWDKGIMKFGQPNPNPRVQVNLFKTQICLLYQNLKTSVVFVLGWWHVKNDIWYQISNPSSLLPTTQHPNTSALHSWLKAHISDSTIPTAHLYSLLAAY